MDGEKLTKLEAYSLVTEFFLLTVEEQKKMFINEWYDYYKVAIKKHKEKIELQLKSGSFL